MGNIKSDKNVVDDTNIQTGGGDVTIGDRTEQTFHIYGMQAGQKEIMFFIRCFIFLMALFGILTVVFVYWPDKEEKLAVFFSGAFFALCFYFLIVLVRTLKLQSININSKT